MQLSSEGFNLGVHGFGCGIGGAVIKEVYYLIGVLIESSGNQVVNHPEAGRLNDQIRRVYDGIREKMSSIASKGGDYCKHPDRKRSGT